MTGWPAYLASSRGIIVAQIDGRGSGGEGDRRRFEMWRRLGSVEVQDQGGQYYGEGVVRLQSCGQKAQLCE